MSKDKLTFQISIDRNADGDQLMLDGFRGDHWLFSVAGPKTSGEHRNKAQLVFDQDDLVLIIKEYAPEIIPKLAPPTEETP